MILGPFLEVLALLRMLVGGISHPSYLRALIHHELSFFPQERSLRTSGSITRSYFSWITQWPLHFSFLMFFSLIQKATSISTCWSFLWFSKPAGQEGPLIWYSSLQTFLTYYTPVFLHVWSWLRALGVGDISDQGQLPRSSTFSTCRSPFAEPWSMSHEDHIYSELIPFQPLHVTNPYQQKYCYFRSSLILST